MHSSDQPVEDSKTEMLSTVVLTAAFCLFISQIDLRLMVFRWGRITVHWGRKEEKAPEEKAGPSLRVRSLFRLTRLHYSRSRSHLVETSSDQTLSCGRANRNQGAIVASS